MSEDRNVQLQGETDNRLLSWTYVIEGEPASKKNSSQIVRVRGKPMLLPNKGYLDYCERAKIGLSVRQLSQPIFFPVRLDVVYYRSNKRRVDKTNLESAVCDVLVSNGIIADDCRDICYDIRGEVLYDKENPRTEITITPIYGILEVWNAQFREAGSIQLQNLME